MSPCNRTCVCVSINPGKHVSRERSTTSAPVGAAAATSLILSPSITTKTFFRNESPRPSNKLPQCSATVFALAFCPKTESVVINKLKKPKATLRIVPSRRQRFMHFLCKPCGQPGGPLYQIHTPLQRTFRNSHDHAYPQPLLQILLDERKFPGTHARFFPQLHQKY